MRNLLVLLISISAFAQSNRVPDLLVRPNTTANRPSGAQGQIYANSSLSRLQYYDGSSWYSLLGPSTTDTVTNKTIDCNNNTCSNFPAVTVSITNDNATNATMYPVWVTTTTGSLAPYVSSTKLSFNPSTGTLTSTAFSGPLTGDVTGNLSGTVTGNASTATALAANPSDCGANQFATTIAASGNLTCAQPAFTDISGTSATTQGGTGLTTYTLGDTIYASAANTLSKLAGNTSTELRVYTQTGDGVNSAAPVWTYQGTSSAVASSFVVRDANQGFTAGQINAVFAPNTTKVATAAGTTTLTATSSQQYIFTGATTQTVTLPVVTTLQNGYYYKITNLSTGQVTVQTSGGNSLQVMSANSQLIATVLDTGGGTGTASWTAHYSTIAPSGGGGGGALKWICGDGLCPPATEENYLQVYLYNNADSQYLYTTIRVPSSYTAGNQINLKLVFYSPDNANNVKFICTSTLIRVGTDAVTSNTNQRTSTNAATTLTAANQAETQTCDLTSTIGEINAVAVAAGSLIKVRVERYSLDTSTSDARLVPDAAEVTFQ